MLQLVLQQSHIGMEVQSISHQNGDRARRFYEIVKYASFISQPLNIGMFVPCDLEGNILEDPKSEYTITEVRKYNQAKERVIFEGFEYDTKMEYCQNGFITFDEEYCENKTIEDLIPFKLKLNNYAIKKLKL